MIEGKIESDRLPFNEQRNWKLKEFHLWHRGRIGDYNFQIIPFSFLKEKKLQFEMSQRKCGKNVLNSQCRNVTVNVSITYWTRHNNSRPFNRSIIHSPFRIDSSGNFFSSVQMNWWSKNIQNEPCIHSGWIICLFYSKNYVFDRCRCISLRCCNLQFTAQNSICCTNFYRQKRPLHTLDISHIELNTICFCSLTMHTHWNTHPKSIGCESDGDREKESESAPISIVVGSVC